MSIITEFEIFNGFINKVLVDFSFIRMVFITLNIGYKEKITKKKTRTLITSHTF